MSRRRRPDPTRLPPSLPGTYHSSPESESYIDDEYSLTPHGELLRARMAAEAARRANNPLVDDWHPDDEPDDVESDDPLAFRAVELETAARRRIRIETAKHSPDPNVWLAADQMTQTEASLRLALYLVRRGHVISDLDVSLTGRELVRSRKPKFPVEAFLRMHGCTRVTRGADWRATYQVGSSPARLRLVAKRDAWDVTAQLAPDARLLVFVHGGPLTPTRSSAEHGSVELLIGHAICRRDASRQDLVVVAVPRSERLRKIAEDVRTAPRVGMAALNVCTIDRAGNVDGLPFFEPYEPPGLTG